MSSSSEHKSVKECLTDIGVVEMDFFHGCDNDVSQEFARVKKAYRTKALRCHPDKGGDAAEFRKLQTAFEVLRELYSKGRLRSFSSELEGQSSTSVDDAYSHVWTDFGAVPTPSWEYFYTAAEAEVPTYRVELAKSNRSACSQKGKAKKCTADSESKSLIDKGEIRVGWMNEESGSYGGWVHLECWRVPSKVWLGVPNPEESTDTHAFATALERMGEVLLSGFSELPPKDQDAFVAHVMDKKKWARLTKRRPNGESENTGQDGTSTSVAKDEATEQQVVRQGYHRDRQYFVVPVPGKDGAIANALQGQTVVLTGTFPEVGGGAGLNLGKDRVKQMVTNFGGRVTSSVSGKTDILVVGKDPGFSKVSKARERPKVQLVNLKELKDVLEGATIENVQPAVITNFSSGYGNNSLATGASAKALAIARGEIAPVIKEGKPKKRKPASNKPKALKHVAENVVITCDECGIDCTERSWFVAKTEEDFCEECHSKNKKKAVPQSKGVTIPAKKEKAQTSRKRRKRA